MDNSSYGHDSYGNYYGSPDNPMGTNPSFARGALICGFISMGIAFIPIVLVFSIPVGAVGLILGLLSGRKGKNIPRRAMTGIIASATGMFLGIIITAISLFTVFRGHTFNEIVDQGRYIYQQIEEGNYEVFER